ncbi:MULTISPECIES: hypothetical protein [unclassified Pseudomonas]|nr:MULTISPECIES: hypothetical protein [unclassified Pseudomonas]
MQLKLLSVFDGEKEIRRIEFKDGINIITNSGANGNQVGKSSSLRAINFCLGGSHDSFWVDPDNGKINEQIKDFLTKGTVRFELTLKLASGLHKLSRTLFAQAQKNRDVIKS